jgi:hypothetical protein
MNNKITLSALLLAAATTVGFMLPGTATASDRHAAKREAPVKFVHYDRQRHPYRHQAPRHVPRWKQQYQRHHGFYFRPWPGYPRYFADKHGFKKYYRRMDSKHFDAGRSRYPGYGDSNIHFRIDYWD